MLTFQRLTPGDREPFQALLRDTEIPSCEYSFVNLYCWGLQTVAFRRNCALLFSHFGGHSVYPCPIGPGDKISCIEDIIADARERGIPCRITCISAADKALMESAFPGRFRFQPDRDSFDYLYAIEDLANLKGRKFQKKRNHINSFVKMHPDCRVEPLTAENVPIARELTAEWYRQRHQENPHGDYLLESTAINRAFRHFGELGLEGILLMDGDTPLAVTMGSRLDGATYDIHFEKAVNDSAYAAVNREFARYLRECHPEIRYLNREDDMGLEGLRKAKLSYNPAALTEKYRAYLIEDCFPEVDEDGD